MCVDKSGNPIQKELCGGGTRNHARRTHTLEAERHAFQHIGHPPGVKT